MGEALVVELERLARRTREAPTQLERQLAASVLAATVERNLEALRDMARASETGRSTAPAQSPVSSLGTGSRALSTQPTTQEAAHE